MVKLIVSSPRQTLSHDDILIRWQVMALKLAARKWQLCHTKTCDGIDMGPLLPCLTKFLNAKLMKQLDMTIIYIFNVFIR